MKFKHKKYTYNKVVSNILDVYNNATREQIREGLQWYSDAHQFAVNLSHKYDVEVIQACGVIAALSPLKAWDENKRIADRLIAGKSGKHTELFKQKARAILETVDVETICDILNGSKIVSFFLNIYKFMDMETVTIDRHALSIAIGYKITDNYGMTINQYKFFEQCYKIAAQKVNLLPLNLQAITWVAWRGESNFEPF